MIPTWHDGISALTWTSRQIDGNDATSQMSIEP
jgi:hypothetical protein